MKLTSSSGGHTLRTKSYMIIGGTLVVTMSAFVALFVGTLFSSLGGIQEDLIHDHVRRVVLHLDTLVREQRNILLDNAIWDETYNFLEGTNPEFVAENFPSYSVTLGTSGQSFITLFSTEKESVAMLRAQNVEENPSLARLATSSLLAPEGVSSAIGILPEGLAIFSGSTVLRSDQAAGSSGWIVFGKVLSPQAMKDFEPITGCSISVLNGSRPEKLKTYELSYSTPSSYLGQVNVFFPGDPRLPPPEIGFMVVLEFRDTLHTSPIFLEMQVPSDVFTAAKHLKNQTLGILVGCLLVFSALCFVVIEVLFLRPIARLDAKIERLAGENGLRADVKAQGGDELVRLSLSATRMHEALLQRARDARSQENLLSSILDTAFEGIMAFQAVRNEAGEIEEFRPILANKSAERILRTPVPEILARSFKQNFPSCDEVSRFQRQCEVVETRMPLSSEFLMTINGQELWIHSEIMPWNDGFVVTFEEISQRKLAEQAAMDQMAEIEQFNRAMVGREERILEMKEEVNRLRSKLGIAKAYTTPVL